MVTYLGSLVQACCGERVTLQTNIPGVCGERLQCLGHAGFAPAGCSAGELPKAGPGLRALPRPKPVRFRLSGAPQRRRLGWACVLCPSQVQQLRRPGAWQVHSPRCGASNHLPHPSHSVSWEHRLRCAVCLLWGPDLWLQPSRWMSAVQDPRKTWLATGSLLAVCRPPACLSASSWAGPQPACSPLVFTQSFVL